LLGDRLTAGRAAPVRALLDPLERPVDRPEHLLGVLLERVVDLAVEGRGRRVAEVVVGVPDDLLRLVLERARGLFVQVVDRVQDALPLLLEDPAEALGVDGAHADAPTSLRSTSAASTPTSSTTFSRAVWPETSATCRRGTSTASARSRTTASFARPPSAGAVTRSFQTSPTRPA